ncbi:hypothetical protein [Mesomycoplasma molare]|uniref:Uncharacterized protein n=1 Tax=Mesomycoplasma molare TaxID=171288 RepID=A0ABY5TYS2_9BACT|nr:hypothetical protein [Mesomycoplasma molare]UWD34194.1 hypothetical protein NX772_03880 [Mesomycoplasma molare]
MKNNLQTKKSQELDLSFDLEILKHENRIIDIKIKGIIRNIKFNSNYFNWFIEDLLFLLDNNGYQKRWDYGQINIQGIKNLNLNEQEQELFIKECKTITNFDLLIKEE